MNVINEEKIRALLGHGAMGGQADKPAFPGAGSSDRGMNLLEYYTAAALTGLLATGKLTHIEQIANTAVATAAATLAELRRITATPER